MKLKRNFATGLIAAGFGLALLVGCEQDTAETTRGADDAGIGTAPADNTDTFGEPDFAPEPSPPPADIGGNVAPPAPPTQSPGGVQSPGAAQSPAGQPSASDSGIDVEER